MFVLFCEGGEMLLVGFGVIRRKRNGAADERGFDGIERALGLPPSVLGPVERFAFA